MNSSASTTDEYVQSLPDWQAKNLETFRQLVHKVNPDVSEEIKWGVPVFVYKSKTVLAMGSFKNHTKYNFLLNGAQLSDTHSLFNNGLESKKSRSIDLLEGQVIQSAPLQELIEQALALV